MAKSIEVSYVEVEGLAVRDSETNRFIPLELVDSRDLVQVALEEMIPRKLMTREELDEILEDEGTVYNLLQDFGQRVLDYLNWKRIMRETLLAEVTIMQKRSGLSEAKVRQDA
jgi:hypothetical protein